MWDLECRCTVLVGVDYTHANSTVLSSLLQTDYRIMVYG